MYIFSSFAGISYICLDSLHISSYCSNILTFHLACFGTFGASLFIFLNYFVWLRIIDEGSVPEMRIWSRL